MGRLARRAARRSTPAPATAGHASTSRRATRRAARGSRAPTLDLRTTRRSTEFAPEPGRRARPARRLRRQRRRRPRASSSTTARLLPVLHRLEPRRDRPLLRSSSAARSSDDGGATFAAGLAGAGARPQRRRSFLTASPWVLVEDGRWRMWYVSGTDGGSSTASPKHRYHISYAESRRRARLDAERARLHRLRERRTSTRSRGRAWSGTAIATGCGSARAAPPTGSATPSRATASRGSGDDARAGARAVRERLGRRDGRVPAGLRPRRRRSCSTTATATARRASAGQKRSKPIEALHPLPELVRLLRLDLPGMRVRAGWNGVLVFAPELAGEQRASKSSPSSCFPPLRTRASGSSSQPADRLGAITTSCAAATVPSRGRLRHRFCPARPACRLSGRLDLVAVEPFRRRSRRSHRRVPRRGAAPARRARRCRSATSSTSSGRSTCSSTSTRTSDALSRARSRRPAGRDRSSSPCRSTRGCGAPTDEFGRHRRRYTRRELGRSWRRRASSRPRDLLRLAAAARAWRSRASAPAEETSTPYDRARRMPQRPASRPLLGAVMTTERALIRAGRSLPAGGSLLRSRTRRDRDRTSRSTGRT